MATKGIKSYGELQMYWRFQLKQVLPANRKVIFWRNDGTDVTTSDTDILHYWGAQTDVAKGKHSSMQSPLIPRARSFSRPQTFFISAKDKETFGSMPLKATTATGDRSTKTWSSSLQESTNPESWVLRFVFGEKFPTRTPLRTIFG